MTRWPFDSPLYQSFMAYCEVPQTAEEAERRKIESGESEMLWEEVVKARTIKRERASQLCRRNRLQQLLAEIDEKLEVLNA